MKQQKIAAALALAAEWREVQGYTSRGGIVVVYGDTVQGWCGQLPAPNAWRPHCYAVDESGSVWESLGGNVEDGAEEWWSVLVAE